jgi:hypothetical protein
VLALIPVQSTAIRAIGYFGGVLTVEFTSGRVFDHPGVPLRMFLEFLADPCKGRYYKARIRGKFR